MNTVATIKAEIIELLKSNPGFRDITVLPEYSGSQKKFALKNPVITVGFDKIELATCAMGAGISEIEEFPALVPEAEITLRFDCMCPANQSFTSYFIDILYDCLIGAGVFKLWSTPVVSDENTLSNKIKVYGIIKALIKPQNDLPPQEKHLISEIIVHKTQEEKERND